MTLATPVDARTILTSNVNHSFDTALKNMGSNAIAAQSNFKLGINAFKEKEYYQAERYLLPLAKNGFKEAQFILGMLYDSASNDRHKALNWYTHAAQNGHSDAQHNLGLAYARGQGIKGDIKLALKWWHAAAEQGNSDSQYNLGIIYATGATGVDQDFKKAKMWWRMAATSGDAMAQYNLGAMYANGVAGQQNLCEAMHWWNLSQENGFSQAHRALENLEKVVDVARCQ
jgi:TPR repeat protein